MILANKRHLPDEPYGSADVVNAGELPGRITLELWSCDSVGL